MIKRVIAKALPLVSLKKRESPHSVEPQGTLSVKVVKPDGTVVKRD